jgi:hypothetical protein
MTDGTAPGSILLPTLTSKIQVSNRTDTFHGQKLIRNAERDDPIVLSRVESRHRRGISWVYSIGHRGIVRPSTISGTLSLFFHERREMLFSCSVRGDGRGVSRFRIFRANGGGRSVLRTRGGLKNVYFCFGKKALNINTIFGNRVYFCIDFMFETVRYFIESRA